MPQPEQVGFTGTRMSYTMVKLAGGRHFYRGAIRRRSDDAVLWECGHEHRLPSQAVSRCAQPEWASRRAQRPEAAQEAP